jgi:hypothetical protein
MPVWYSHLFLKDFQGLLTVERAEMSEKKANDRHGFLFPVVAHLGAEAVLERPISVGCRVARGYFNMD